MFRILKPWILGNDVQGSNLQAVESVRVVDGAKLQPVEIASDINRSRLKALALSARVIEHTALPAVES